MKFITKSSIWRLSLLIAFFGACLEPPVATGGSDQGTAFFINSDGYLATCNHVVNGMKTFRIIYHGQSYPAWVVSQDKSNDTALLKTYIRSNSMSLSLQTQEHGDYSEVIGFPAARLFGRNLKSSKGYYNYFNVFLGQQQYEMTSYQGNSGSPIVDQNGHVKGILCAGWSIPKYNMIGGDVSFGRLIKYLVNIAANMNVSVNIDEEPRQHEDFLTRAIAEDTVVLIYGFDD